MNRFSEVVDPVDLGVLEFEILMRRDRIVKSNVAPTFEELGMLADIEETLRRAQILVESARITASRLNAEPEPVAESEGGEQWQS